MDDYWSAWWDEWQLRILVLGSLGLQWFLLVAAPMRKYDIPWWFRTCIRLAYIGSDSLAIYALATLFDRHPKASSSSNCNCNGGGGKGSVLEILWAPVLLIHLGGKRELTTYSVEDDGMSMRHTITVVSQVLVAMYNFYKSWPSTGDRRLWASAILLFVVGMLSFSANKLFGGGDPAEEEEEEKKKIVCCKWKRKTDKWYWSTRKRVHMLLSDMSLFAAASDLKRRGELHRHPERDEEGDNDREICTLTIRAERRTKPTKEWLRQAFELTYIRASVQVWTPAYLAYHLLLVPALHAAAITLFTVSVKRGPAGYNAMDVKYTYLLLCFTAALDILGVFFDKLVLSLMGVHVPRLGESISQYNLMDAVLRRMMKPAVGWLIKCAGRIGCYERYFVTKYNKLFSKVARYLLFDFLRSDQIKGLDLGSYRNLDSGMNNWILNDDLRRDACGKGTEVRNTLLGSFDRSVLLWHIATDLCFCLEPPTAPVTPREVNTEAISNYMAHMLNFRPVMLLTGSRQHLFAEAMDQVEAILKLRPAGRHFKRPAVQDDKAMADTIFTRTVGEHGCRDKLTCDNTSGPPEFPLVHDACRLTQELLRLHDETRYELMYRVWAGMLFYSAAMSRGYLHAKSLGEGGEFLTFVWLHLSIKGTKTLSDKLQMPDQIDADGRQDAQGSQQGEVFLREQDWQV